MHPLTRSGFALAWIALLLAGAAPAERPNIVLIMADDIGAECYGAYGSTHYKTPRVDALAEAGARFTHAYSQPICTPSRVKIMTGLYNFRNYIDFGRMDVTKPTFATMLRDAGYATCVAGKWQLTPGDLNGPHTAGFEDYCLWHFQTRDDDGGDPRFASKGERYQSPVLFRNGARVPDTEGKYGPQVVTEYVCDFITRNQAKPFFVYYPMLLTHGPFQPTPHSDAWPGTEDHVRHFPDMVAYMDHCIGQIVDTLAALDLLENTLVLVTGDNGTDRKIASPFPGRPDIQGGKGSMTDAGTHVAFVAHWPRKIKPGTVVDAPIDFADVLPTLADATGAPLPGPVDGVSLLPLMLGDASQARGWIFMSYSRNGPADTPFRCFVRDARWKLYDDGGLYDVDQNPLEQTPASGPEATAARARLAPHLARLLGELRTTSGT